MGVALGIASIAMAAAGTAAQVVAQQRAANANKAVLSRNAELADRASKVSLLAGASQASEALSQGSRVAAEARAAAAAGGVDIQSGGVTSLLETTKQTATMDVETIRNNALREALGYQAQADQFRAESRAVSRQARFGMYTSLLTGAGQMLGQAYGMRSSPRPVSYPSLGRG